MNSHSCVCKESTGLPFDSLSRRGAGFCPAGLDVHDPRDVGVEDYRWGRGVGDLEGPYGFTSRKKRETGVVRQRRGRGECGEGDPMGRRGVRVESTEEKVFRKGLTDCVGTGEDTSVGRVGPRVT